MVAADGAGREDAPKLHTIVCPVAVSLGCRLVDGSHQPHQLAVQCVHRKGDYARGITGFQSIFSPYCVWWTGRGKRGVLCVPLPWSECWNRSSAKNCGTNTQKLLPAKGGGDEISDPAESKKLFERFGRSPRGMRHCAGEWLFGSRAAAATKVKRIKGGDEISGTDVSGTRLMEKVVCHSTR